MKSRLPALLLFLTAVGCSISCAQVAPAARKDDLKDKIRIGVGYSNFSSAWRGHLEGPVVWVDITPNSKIRGLGIMIEARDLNYGRNSFYANHPQVEPLREETALAGLSYHFLKFKSFQPYVKFGAGLGGVYGLYDSLKNSPNSHDTRTVFAPSGGVDMAISNHVWIRGEYSYQYWPNIHYYHSSSANGVTMHPNGVSVGAVINF